MEASLIIPAHNEELRLSDTLASYGKALQGRFGDDFETLVIANGCTDKTVEVAGQVATGLPGVRIVDIEEPVGKGGAIIEGFRQSSGRGVLFADADGATASGSLLGLFNELDRHDIVVGSRRLKESNITRRQPLLRQAFGRTFAATAHLLFDVPVRDTQCGAKAFRREAAHRLAGVVSETRWTFDLDLLISAQNLGLEVGEYPVEWADRTGSRLRFAPTAFEVVRSLWKMKFQRETSARRGQRVPEGGDANTEGA